jgi:predicted N-formylglutamate amidohydrolase
VEIGGVADFSRQVVVTCEHASNALPPGLELDEGLRSLHIAWDPGALPIAETIAERFKAPLIAGEYSRLLVDLNRTVGNRMLIRRVSDGHRIPFNYGLDEAAVQERIERYYDPYRNRVIEAADAAIERHGRCVHICVHTFTPALAGNVRGNDIGLLHDPNWGIERVACAELRDHLDAATDHVTWFNRPYSGTADGILPAMRRRYEPHQFVGIELEVNQKYADDAAALEHISVEIAEGLASAPSLAG